MKNKIHQGFLVVVIALASFNLATGLIHALKPKMNPNTFPLHQLAEPFKPFKNIFSNQRTAGYLTDKNLDDLPVIARYELGQFTLAPTVLLLNKASSALVFIDASSPEAAVKLIKDNHLTLVHADKTGLLLTINPALAGQP